ncbi:MAG: M42 family metallopeptidase [Ruminococcaceae bacterium]|nr:M42 family metallopeptidase [Oscillospiraceae bacterium]
MKQLLKQLSVPCSITGHNQKMAKLIRDLVLPFCDSVEIDDFGNVIGVKYGTTGKTVLLDAHMDEVGLQVKEIQEDGSLSFVTVGGIDPRILPCSEVIVHGKKELYGVIGAKPPHLLKDEDKKGELRIADMVIDVGMTHPDEMVRIGDAVSFYPVCRELGKDRISCKGLDNKCGVAIMLYVMQSLTNCPHTVVFSATTAEEMGCLGVAALMERQDVDLAIVTDVTFGMTPGEDEGLCFPLGSGAAICTGPCIHPNWFEKACKTAEQHGIPYMIEVEGRTTGTNTDVIQLSNTGVPSLLISVPLRYMHTMTEIVQFSDMEAAARLITLLVGGDLAC